jgi:hypothetical protein
MRLFDQLRYSRTILIILPLGLVLLFLGWRNLINSPSDVNDFRIIEGLVKEFYIKPIFIKSCDCEMETFFLKVNGRKNEIKTRVEKNVSILKSLVKKNSKVRVWTDDDNYIQQLEIQDETVIKYKRSIKYTYFFILAGLIISVVSIVYLLRYPDDIKRD